MPDSQGILHDGFTARQFGPAGSSPPPEPAGPLPSATEVVESQPASGISVTASGSGTSAAYEGSVFVVGFTRNALGTRFGRKEFHFADQNSAPGFVDASAELAFHAFNLFLPGFIVRGNFQPAVFAPDRASMSGESFTDDTGPRSRQPCERRFRAVEPFHHSSEKFSGFLHEGRGF
jgi:hypothetical protein